MSAKREIVFSPNMKPAITILIAEKITETFGLAVAMSKDVPTDELWVVQDGHVVERFKI